MVMMTEKDPRIKILWVEDDNLVAELGTLWLKMLGYEADSAQNGKEALSLMKEKPYPIVITDLQMPVMNGYDLIQEIRKIYGEECFIVVISGSQDHLELVKDFSLANALMSKPIVLKELKKVLNTAIQ